MMHKLEKQIISERGKEVLTVHVKVDKSQSMQISEAENVNMILFHGTAEGEDFAGEILPGGVDTQRYYDGENRLSARYMIAGKDAAGENCSIYIENNGISAKEGLTTTKATIKTNCKSMMYLNEVLLTGYIEPGVEKEKEDIIIRLYKQ